MEDVISTLKTGQEILISPNIFASPENEKIHKMDFYKIKNSVGEEYGVGIGKCERTMFSSEEYESWIINLKTNCTQRIYS